jgi:LmbE family N-acetylglucosaminyl deacetylase
MSQHTHTLPAVVSRAVLTVSVALAAGVVSWPSLQAQVRPVYSRGAAGVLHQIEKLGTTASALVTAAHPDDEDSAFMARVARGDHGRVAYLSLNRGEGGQNVIGPELFEALGVIRTEELLQARTLDGAAQLFGRTFDYGFSKTIEEAARFWGEQDVLGDMVRTIRQYRPLVIYSRFSGTPADGHGQHQLVGKLTPLAFHAAADPTIFPEQLKQGLRPWQARKLYRSVGFRPGSENEATTRIETGQVDALLGRSYFEIAAEGRSQHKSQEMGVPEARGPQQSGLVLLDSTVKTGSGETSVFDGLDTSIPGLAALAGLPAGSLASGLAAIDRAVTKGVDQFDARNPSSIVPSLADALVQIRAARRSVATLTAPVDARSDADFLLAIKERDATLAMQMASGAVVDVVSDVETVAPGESFGATVRVFLAHPTLVKVTGVSLRVPGGWTAGLARPAAPDESNFMARMFRERPDRAESFALTVPADAQPTQPYWLTTPREGAMFTWPAGAPAGAPFDDALVIAEVRADIGGVPVTLVQPLQYRLVDPVRGELRRNVDVTPAVTVALDSQLEIVPLASLGQPRRIAVRLQSNAQTAQSGTVTVQAPDGWTVDPPHMPFTLGRKGDRTAVSFSVTPAKATPAGSYRLKASASVAGRAFGLTMRTVSYPHIQTHRLYAPAEALVRVFDLKVAPVTVAYIMGSGDQIPDALRRMGVAVTLLDDDALGAVDLSRFNTVVVGIRASEARPDFVANNGRLLDYGRNGGTLIVLYQQPDYAARNLTPFPAQMASRVTDETAPVRILAPDHPVFTTPNRITDEDFQGWVQERNLYAFTAFDPQYTALLESHDPGEPPQVGGQVYARLGKGQYVYTACAWFRQLPAGVPGAYRQFANLVSLGAK